MRRAFVLINTDLGSEERLLSDLRKVEGIVGVYVVYGVYDIVAEIEADSEQEFKEIIFSRIRKLKQVRSTLTLTIT